MIELTELGALALAMGAVCAGLGLYLLLLCLRQRKLARALKELEGRHAKPKP